MNNEILETDQISVGSAGIFHPNIVSSSVICSIKFRCIVLEAIFWASFTHAQGEKPVVAQHSKDLPDTEDNRKLRMFHFTANPKGTWCISDGVTPDNLACGQTLSLYHHGYSPLEWLRSVKKSNLSSTLTIWPSADFKWSCRTTFEPQVKWQYYL